MLILGTVAGCTVGPDYRGAPDVAPHASHAPQFERATIAAAPASTPAARWWDGLGDAELSHLIDLALANSPTLAVAQARILQARATLAEQDAGLYPSVSATAAAARARLPTGDLANAASAAGLSPSTTAEIPRHVTASYYQAGFDAMWELDLFGGQRRAIEGARASTEAAVAMYQDAQVQLAAEVGQAYVSLRQAQVRGVLAEQSRATAARMLALTQDQRNVGTADDVALQKAQAQLKQADAALLPLQAQAEQMRDQLALLAGREPGALDGELTAPGAVPLPPAVVAVGDPAAMLRRRPDIRAAERQLAASNAAVGQAVAGLFPTVSLLGTIGLGSSKPGELFHSNNLSKLGAPVLRWNVFDFGKARAQVREQQAGSDASLAQYRSTVLSALNDAETSLSRYGRQRAYVQQLDDAQAAQNRVTELTMVRYRGGTASYLQALDAESQRLQSEQTLVQARAELSTDYVSLQKSLGLGWSAPPVADPVATR